MDGPSETEVPNHEAPFEKAAAPESVTLVALADDVVTLPKT